MEVLKMGNKLKIRTNFNTKLVSSTLKCSSGNKPCGKICIDENFKCHRDIAGNYYFVPVSKNPDLNNKTKNKPEPSKNNKSNLGIIIPAVSCTLLATVGLALAAGASGPKPAFIGAKTGEQIDNIQNLSPGAVYVRDQVVTEILSKSGIDNEETTRQKLSEISLELPDDLEQVQIYNDIKLKAYTLLNKLDSASLSDRDDEEFTKIFGMPSKEYPSYYKEQRDKLNKLRKEYKEAIIRGEVPQAPKVRLMGNGEFSQVIGKVGSTLKNVDPENVFLRKEFERQLRTEQLKLITFCDARFNYNAPIYKSITELSETEKREKAQHDKLLAEFDLAIEQGQTPPAIITQERWKNLTSYVNNTKNISNILRDYNGDFNSKNYNALEKSINTDRRSLIEMEPIRAQMIDTWQKNYWDVINSEDFIRQEEITSKQVRDEAYEKIKQIPGQEQYQRTINEYRAKTELMSACLYNMYDDLDLPQNNNLVDRIERTRESMARDSAVSLVNFANDTESLLENRDRLIQQFMMERGGDDGGGVGFLLLQDEPFQDYDNDRRIDKKKLYNRLAGYIEKIDVPEISREEISQQRRIWAGMVVDADTTPEGHERMRQFLLRDFQDRTGVNLADPKYSVRQNATDTLENPEYANTVLYDKSTWDIGENWVKSNFPDLKDADQIKEQINKYLRDNGYDRFTVMDPNPAARLNDNKWRMAIHGSLKSELNIDPEEIKNLSGTELIDSILGSYQNVVHNRAIQGKPIFYQGAHKFYIDGLTERSLKITGDKEITDRSYNNIKYSPGKQSFTRDERGKINTRENRKAARARLASLEPSQLEQLNSILNAVKTQPGNIVPKAKKIVKAYTNLAPDKPPINELMAAWLIKNSMNFSETMYFSENSENILLEFNCSYPNCEGYPISQSAEDFLYYSEISALYITINGLRSFTMAKGEVIDVLLN
jgi:hypothetical protein